MLYELSNKEISELKKAQQDELVGQYVYNSLSKLIKDPHNSKILARISDDEKRHVNIFRKYTGEDLKVNKYKVFFYVFISRIFGNFWHKLQEKAGRAQNYRTCLKYLE